MFDRPSTFSLQLYSKMGSFTGIFQVFWQLIMNTSGWPLQKRQMLQKVLLKFMNQHKSNVE